MIYDKTIAMLRCCADSTTGCGDCVFKEKFNCICELLDHAANVIEAADKRIEELEKQHGNQRRSE